MTTTGNSNSIKLMMITGWLFLAFIGLPGQAEQMQTIELFKSELAQAKNSSDASTIELLENNYEQISGVVHHDLKIAYGYTLGTMLQRESIKNNFKDADLVAKSRQYYLDVLSLDNRHLGTRKNLVLLLESSNDYQDAIRHIDTLLQYDPFNSNRYYLTRGDIYMEMNAGNKALESFKKVIEIDPENQNAIRNIALLYNKNSSSEEKQVLLNYARSLMSMETPVPAMRLLERYMEITLPDDTTSAESALTSWADLLSGMSYISDHDFDLLPATDSSFQPNGKVFSNWLKIPYPIRSLSGRLINACIFHSGYDSVKRK